MDRAIKDEMLKGWRIKRFDMSPAQYRRFQEQALDDENTLVADTPAGDVFFHGVPIYITTEEPAPPLAVGVDSKFQTISRSFDLHAIKDFEASMGENWSHKHQAYIYGDFKG